ncbi:uncharacterized protein LOC129279103 [Lytechinus pictus]|uniref:uncharacterized protein LOC129279103 n=1 Tax=Lytechinus pictus TaxID=7653 RepID=UPI0030B9B66F
MENQQRRSLWDLLTIGLLLSTMVTGTSGSCSLLSITPTGNACSLKTFTECSAAVRSGITVTSATVTHSGTSVNATAAANDIIQCSEKSCIELAYFLLAHYSEQFCMTLVDGAGGLFTLTAEITVSYSGGSHNSFEATFDAWNDQSFFNGNTFPDCLTFIIASQTSGVSATPGVGSSLTQYTNGDCDEQPSTSPTTQPSTTPTQPTSPPTTTPTTQQTTPATTQPTTPGPTTSTQPPTTQSTQPATVQTETTSITASSASQSATYLGTTSGVDGHCGTFKIGDSNENCLPKISPCITPDFNASDIIVVSAMLRMSHEPPEDVTRLVQGVIGCSQDACEGAIYEVIQLYSRIECLSAEDGMENISIDIEYTYESVTFNIQADSIFTIDEDGLHTEYCDNLYYQSRPNTTSNTIDDDPFDCALLDESRYGDSSTTDTSDSTETRGCPRLNIDFVEDISIGAESCGPTFVIESDSPRVMNARVSFESQDQNEVVGGATDVIQDGIDSSGNLLHVVSLVMSIDIEDGNSTLDLNGSVIIDFAVNLTGSSNILYCAFIANESSGVWSSSGMEVVSANSTLVRCRSNHLTSFAVLLSAKPPKGLNAVIQSHLSRIMGSLSVLCLTLALFIYVATGTWKQLKIQIHINLAVSTALGQLLFMTMAEMTWNRIVCKTIAVTLQYLFTSALAWTMIEGVFLYRTTAVGFKPLRIGWLSLFAWGGSLVVVGVSFGVLYDGYGSTSYCWLRHDDHTIYVFVGCVFAVLLFNSMILFFVMRSFMGLKANAKKDELDKFKAMTRAMLILLPILGLTWFAGAITSITKSDHVIFFQYLFIISFGMQGICILIFHCLQVPAIKAVLKNRIHRRVKDSSWTSKSGAQRSTTVTSTF